MLLDYLLDRFRISLVEFLLWFHEQLTNLILWLGRKEMSSYQEYYEIQKAEWEAGMDFAKEEIPEEFRKFLEGI